MAFLALPPLTQLRQDDALARSRIERIVTLYYKRQFVGAIREQGKTFPPGFELSVSAQSAMPRLHTEDSLVCYEFLLATQATFPVLYVGMTETQTLSARIDQHRQGFQSSAPDQGSFAYRARANGVAFGDLRFNWVAARNRADIASLRNAERLLQTLLNPLLSER